MTTYFIRSADIALVISRRLSQQENGNKILNDSVSPNNSRLESGSRAGRFESLRTFKRTEGGFSWRIRYLLNHARE